MNPGETLAASPPLLELCGVTKVYGQGQAAFRRSPPRVSSAAARGRRVPPPEQTARPRTRLARLVPQRLDRIEVRPAQKLNPVDRLICRTPDTLVGFRKNGEVITPL